MLHLAHVTADLTEAGTIKFRRILPLGSIDTDTDDATEIAARLGVDAAIRNSLSRLIKATQVSPTAPRSVGAVAESDGGPTTLLVVVTIGTTVTRINFGTLDFDRDGAPEVNMRTSALEVFRAQLSEILALAAANPTLEIGTGLVFTSDRGASVA